MKLKYHLLVMTVLLGLFACAPTIKGPNGADKTEKGRALHEQAEKLFKAKAYEEALKVYDEYLAKYPDQPLADEALMKMGRIYAALGRDEAELKAYQRLVKDYPESRFVSDAMLEILSTYYNKGRFKAVIIAGSRHPRKDGFQSNIYFRLMFIWQTLIWPWGRPWMPYILSILLIIKHR